MNSNSVRTVFATMAVILVSVCVSQTRTAQSSSATASEATPKPLLLEKNESDATDALTATPKSICFRN
jgi:hypothetical protein